jgi:hypothetical protein
MLRRGQVHGIAGQLADLRNRVDALRPVVPLVIARVDGTCWATGREWPSLDAMRAELAKEQDKMPLVVQLSIDGPETAEEGAK